MDDEDTYLSWLVKGKTPDDVRNDLINRGYSKEEANEISRYIDNVFLTGRIETKLNPRPAQNGSSYRIIDWLIVAVAVFVSIFMMPVIFGWFVFAGVGGVGFAFIRYGNRLESSGIIRQHGFRKRIARNR